MFQTTNQFTNDIHYQFSGVTTHPANPNFACQVDLIQQLQRHLPLLALFAGTQRCIEGDP